MTPKLLGIKVYKEYAVKDVVDYIDWNPFFQVGVCISLPCCATHPQTHPLWLMHSISRSCMVLNT